MQSGHIYVILGASGLVTIHSGARPCRMIHGRLIEMTRTQVAAYLIEARNAGYEIMRLGEV